MKYVNSYKKVRLLVSTLYFYLYLMFPCQEVALSIYSIGKFDLTCHSVDLLYKLDNTVCNISSFLLIFYREFFLGRQVWTAHSLISWQWNDFLPLKLTPSHRVFQTSSSKHFGVRLLLCLWNSVHLEVAPHLKRIYFPLYTSRKRPCYGGVPYNKSHIRVEDP